MITIHVNNTPQDIEDQSSINDLLTKLDRSPDGIAIAINREVILKAKWPETLLTENDQVLIIQATQGG